MTFIKSSFYNLNRIYLLLLGIWPYQKSKFVHIQKLIILGLFISSLVCKLLLLVTKNDIYDMTLLFNTLSQALLSVFYLILYNTFVFNNKTIKVLLEQMEHDWTTLKDKELQIMKQYAKISRFYMIIFTLLIIIVICSFIFIHLLPIILDSIIPLNISRPRHLYARYEFFIDEERYFHMILLYSVLLLWFGLITIASTGSSLYTFAHHSCAMFKIACYRMEHAMDDYKILDIVKQNKVQNRIISAMDMHREAIKYINILISSLAMCYICMILCGVTSLTVNLFHFLQAFKFAHNEEEILLSTFLISTHFLGLFLSHYASQMITNYFDDIFIAAYSIPWYVAPIQIQKLVIFLLQRGTKTFVPQVAGLFTGSLESFATMVSTSLSYMMVIIAVQ